MSNPTNSTEEKIVDAVMEELRELEPLGQVLDGLRDEQDSVLRTSLADRVHEHVEPYRVSERALRDIVKSLAEQNDQTPVRAEVVFGEKTAAITVSLPTLTPEREAHFGQSICSTIGGMLGLTLGKVKSFGTDAEDAARRPPAGVGWDGLPEDGPHRRGTDAVMDELRRTPFGANIPSFVQPNTDISFMCRGERNWARVYEIKRTPADGPITAIRTVGGGVYEAKDLSDVRLEANPCAAPGEQGEPPGREAAYDVKEYQTLRVMLGDDTSTGVRFEYDRAQCLYGSEWDRRVYFQSSQNCWMVSFTRDEAAMAPSFFRLDKIRNAVAFDEPRAVRGRVTAAPRRKEYPEIGEKHEFPVLEVVQYLHGHATGSGGGLTQETAQKWATWLEWRITKGWDESWPISAAYDEQIREFAKTVIAMFAGEKPEPLLEKLALICDPRVEAIEFDFAGVTKRASARTLAFFDGYEMRVGGPTYVAFPANLMRNVRVAGAVG